MSDDTKGAPPPASKGKPPAGQTPIERALTEASVLRFLRAHSDFLSRHPELFETLTPPSAVSGERVADFQAYAIKNLQQRVKEVEGNFASAVSFARENVSVQAQVHEAVLRLIRARTLEQLLEVLTVDLVQVFDADVVRLGLESEIADLYESYHSEHHYSGIVFLGAGALDVFFGDKGVLLFADTAKSGGFLVDELFQNCARLALSVALLRLDLPTLGRDAVVGFGVRFTGRYDEHHATDLLAFLAQVIAERLDATLQETGLEM